MKKGILSALIVCALLVSVFAVSASAADFSAAMSSASGKAGETVTITVSINNDEAIRSIAYNGITFNAEAIEFVRGDWAYGDAKQANSAEQGACSLTEAQVITGDVLTLSFKILDSAAAGEYDVSGLISIARGQASATVSGKITVVADETTTEPESKTEPPKTTEPETTTEPATEPTTPPSTEPPVTTTTTTKPSDSGTTTTTKNDESKSETTTAKKTGGANTSGRSNGGKIAQTGESRVGIAVASVVGVIALAGTAVAFRKKHEN